MPQERHLEGRLDKSKLGLKRVPRVESWQGMIFGSFDPEIESLDRYLGDMRWYLDAFFERFPGGIEFMGSPQRWLIDANWKLPMENQLGDVNHGPFLHAAVIPPEANEEVFALGYSCVTEPGHGATFRLMPEDAPLESVAYGFEGMASLLAPEVHEYLREIQAKAVERVGPIRARMKGLTYGVYPNLSFLWSNTAFKVSHPRGPGRVEYWSWAVVPADAPEAFKANPARQPYGLLRAGRHPRAGGFRSVDAAGAGEQDRLRGRSPLFLRARAWGGEAASGPARPRRCDRQRVLRTPFLSSLARRSDRRRGGVT